MNCPKCGKEISENATLCTSCGWKSQKWEINKQQGKLQHGALVAAIITIVILSIFSVVALAIII